MVNCSGWTTMTECMDYEAENVNLKCRYVKTWKQAAEADLRNLKISNEDA